MVFEAGHCGTEICVGWSGSSCCGWPGLPWPKLARPVFNCFCPFFVTEDFQRWAILNNHLKIGKTWESYKLLPKELVLKSTNDPNYYENKIKVGSLSSVFRQRGCPDAIGIDTASNQYFYADQLNASEYYNPCNDFAQGYTRY